jgi:hypothetical protein
VQRVAIGAGSMLAASHASGRNPGPILNLIED